MTQTRKIVGLSAIGLMTALLIAASFYFLESSAKVSSVMIGWAGLQTMVAFWALAWTLTRSGNAFYSIFVGDALLRLVGLGVAVYWLWAHRLPYTGVLLCLAFSFLFFSLIQIPFFHRTK